MANDIEGRSALLQALREELVGPSPQGTEIDCTRPISFDDAPSSYGPWRQKGSGEEILQRDPPCKRYGVGVLYPLNTQPKDKEAIDNDQALNQFCTPEQTDADDMVTSTAQRDISKIESRESRSAIGESQPNDPELPSADTTRPSSIGISFLADVPQESLLTVEVTGGRYHRHTIFVQGKERIWWLRSPVKIKAEFSAAVLRSQNEIRFIAQQPHTQNTEGLDVNVEVFSRPYKSLDKRLITVCLVNRSKHAHSAYDQSCLFQCSFRASITSIGKSRHIYPYPDAIEIGMEGMQLPFDEEEESLALLYRKAKTFAVGHGCSADWESVEGTWNRQLTSGNNANIEKIVETVAWVSAENLPMIEIPSITPDVQRHDGTKVEVEMAPLAGLVPGSNGMSALEEITLLYEEWIEKQDRIISSSLERRYRNAAKIHIEECRKCLTRMKQGIQFLKSNAKALKAFQLANQAMLLQQIHSRREPRKIAIDPKTNARTYTPAYSQPDPLKPQGGRGKWRAFQIAFLLMSIQSAADPNSEDRKLVELIWFPTGGGKTEAYLGLAAFAMFMRRLENKDDAGVQVLMRYTLRLLTAQQFQRASSLLCAMEYIRRQNTHELGTREFSIGVWLGNATTPNTRKEAVQIYNGLKRNDKYTENKFILNKCPWCGAQMGPIKTNRSQRSNDKIPVPGYERRGNTVVFECPDDNCDFYRGLPVYVIDEDIYEKRPTMLIGTVDKFALIAWRSEVRSIFGIDVDGNRVYSPPNLIIQDELHLISGPLGSMVGLYETIIEELCTDRRHGQIIQPKIVSSTATIRRYKEQIHRLYGRQSVALFPSPGLSADDSFFSRYATDRQGRLERGRIYVGVHAPGLGSLQTVQVRSFTSLLQAPLLLAEDKRDPWWTLLLFFNSLRELGTTLSLFQSDIPDYFQVVRQRTGRQSQDLRKFYNLLELTGRLQNDEVPEAITKLEIEYKQGKQKDQPVDVCLASNIIEVGVDIDRLSLMAVVGQPKTTSQYIQVTGRVGRRWSERPGLIVTLYGITRPRDRSHFEKFRSYHERLYAQVEPTSVTPFSPPVLDRALHAVMVTYVRQLGNKDNARSPYPYPSHLIEKLREIILPRVQAIDPDEAPNFLKVFERRAEEWQRWERNVWDDYANKDTPLLRQAGAHVIPELERLSWATANSMRDVDAQCDATITGLYLLERNEGE